MTTTPPRSLFEGSYLGDGSRIAAVARMECGICWHVYDPALGDPIWQVAAGTPFADLPAHWRCPNCDAPRHKFMVLDGTGAPAAEPGAAPPRDRLAERVAALEAAYRAADERLRGLPVHNPALTVEAIGFRAQPGGEEGEGLFGIVITPWFMNLTLLPADPDGWAGLRPGETVGRALPSGRYDFLVGELAGVGLVLTCSLFSPMEVFVDMAAARIAAQAALEEVWRPPTPAPGSMTGPGRTGLSREVGRRSLFRAAAE